MDAAAVEAEAAVLDAEISTAMERVLDAAEAALRLTDSPEAQGWLHEILEACSLGDLAHQRLQRIGRLARGEAAPEGGLLDGPAAPGAGLDQAAADRLMAFD